MSAELGSGSDSFWAASVEVSRAAERPEKAALDRYSGGIAARTRARCQTDIASCGAARWRGPPGHPEKAALDRYSGGRDSGPGGKSKQIEYL